MISLQSGDCHADYGANQPWPLHFCFAYHNEHSMELPDHRRREGVALVVYYGGPYHISHFFFRGLLAVLLRDLG